jgi:hypothetical protein
MDSAGARALVRSLTKIAPRALALRTAALVVVGALVVPAITECAGWIAAANGHSCCANRGGMAAETSLKACCGVSEQSNEATPTETQTTRTPLKLLSPHFAPAVAPFSSRTLLPGEPSSLRRAAFVPLYLQQASLLI